VAKPLNSRWAGSEQKIGVEFQLQMDIVAGEVPCTSLRLSVMRKICVFMYRVIPSFFVPTIRIAFIFDDISMRSLR
jgi:hypothetical protein